MRLVGCALGERCHSDALVLAVQGLVDEWAAGEVARAVRSERGAAARHEAALRAVAAARGAETPRAVAERHAEPGHEGGGVGGGRRKWRGAEFMRYCGAMGTDVWRGCWRRAGEEALPARGDG